jgi:hypothetical protein
MTLSPDYYKSSLLWFVIGGTKALIDVFGGLRDSGHRERKLYCCVCRCSRLS